MDHQDQPQDHDQEQESAVENVVPTFDSPNDDDSFNQDAGPALYDDLAIDADLAAANPDLVDDMRQTDERCRLSGRDKCNLIVGLVLICIVVVGVLVPVVLIKREEAEIEDSKNITTAAPTVSPMPTASPTSLRALERDAITANIVAATNTPPEVLDDPNTPQGMALDWLLYEDPAQLTDSSPNLIQKYALMTLFYGSDGQSSDTLDWDDNGVADECSWYGIGCHGDAEGTNSSISSPTFASISSIQINGTNLFGSLVSEIGLLSDLNILRLAQNQYSGELPEELFGLQQLTRLNLEENKFTSTISDGIGRLSNLQVLSMYDNSFDGSLPATMGNLTNLRELYLQFNFLSGPIVDYLLQMPLLEVVDVALNRFSGGIPASISSLGRMKTLFLYGNLFSGEIPPELGDVPSLKELILSENRFDGTIPTALGQLTSLTYLAISQCQLNGPIPTELGLLSQLTYLDLSQQTLTGFIPRQLGNLTSLEQLSLSQNNLRGNIPSELGACAKLQVLDLIANNIGGSVADEICALRPNPLEILTTDCRSQVTCPPGCCTSCGR